MDTWKSTRFLLPFLAAGLFACAGGQPRRPSKVDRAVFLSLDGFPFELLQRDLVRHHMPTLLGLLQEGIPVPSLSTFPSKTPVAHAALWTGAWGGVNGIAAPWLLRLPASDFTIQDRVSGFSSLPLRAEPIFVAAARQGVPTLVVTATQTYPFSSFLEERRFGLSRQEEERLRENLTLFSLYDGRLAEAFTVSQEDFSSRPGGSGQEFAKADRIFERDLTLRLKREPPESPWYGRQVRVRLEGLWRFSAAHQADHLALELSGPGIHSRLEIPTRPLRFFSLSFPLFGRTAAFGVQLLEASSEGRLLLYFSPPHILLSTAPAQADKIMRELALHGNGASRALRSGRLGRTLWQGGQGRAEEYYTRTAVELIKEFERFWNRTTRDKGWRLACAYLPYPDELLHLWYGFLNPHSPGYDAHIAERLKPLAGRVLEAVDHYLSSVLARLGPADALILTSDHGMRPTTRLFFPNRMLARAHLLATDGQGRLDLGRTRAWFNTHFGAVINRRQRSGGIVGDAGATIARVTRLLEQVRDPQTGDKIVTTVLTPGDREGRQWGVGGPGGSDLLFDVRPPYYTALALSSGKLVEKSPPAGSHGYAPSAHDMLAMMVLRGPGVQRLRGRQEPVRHIDAAPTIAFWLGIDPPRQAQGRSLARAGNQRRRP